MRLTDPEISNLIVAVFAFVLGLFVASGRADWAISISSFSKTKLEKNFKATAVRWIKATSLFLCAFFLILSAFVNEHFMLVGLICLLLADPIMLLYKKRLD